jgi:hypothetical protein
MQAMNTIPVKIFLIGLERDKEKVFNKVEGDGCIAITPNLPSHWEEGSMNKGESNRERISKRIEEDIAPHWTEADQEEKPCESLSFHKHQGALKIVYFKGFVTEFIGSINSNTRHESIPLRHLAEKWRGHYCKRLW